MENRVGERALLLGVAASAVAALQPWTMLAVGDADVSSLTALAKNPAQSKRMFVAMLAFMPAIFVAYWIAVRDVAGRMPVTAPFAALAFATWFLLEILPRSFDLWVVQGRWLAEYAAADPARRHEMDGNYALYRDAVQAVGFVRRHALLIGQACLAFSVWQSGLLGKLLAAALALSVVRLVLGSLALYAGMPALFAIADPMYFVTAAAVFPLLAGWLWRQRRRG
jgi:hypothetical protein